MDSSRNHHLLLTKEGRNRVGPPPLARSKGRQCEGVYPVASLACLLSARSFCPGLRAMHQICLCPPGTATASPLTSQESPSPLLVRLKPYRNGCFVSFGPRRKLLLFSCPFLPCKVAGSSLAKAFPVLPPGPRAILDRVSFTRALSPAFLTCRARFCLGSCNTKGICAHFSQSGAVHHQPGQAPSPLQSWLQAPGFPCPSQGP